MRSDHQILMWIVVLGSFLIGMVYLSASNEYELQQKDMAYKQEVIEHLAEINDRLKLGGCL